MSNISQNVVANTTNLKPEPSTIPVKHFTELRSTLKRAGLRADQREWFTRAFSHAASKGGDLYDLMDCAISRSEFLFALALTPEQFEFLGFLILEENELEEKRAAARAAAQPAQTQALATAASAWVADSRKHRDILAGVKEEIERDAFSRATAAQPTPVEPAWMGRLELTGFLQGWNKYAGTLSDCAAAARYWPGSKVCRENDHYVVFIKDTRQASAIVKTVA